MKLYADMSQLSDEQKRRIEENRKKALALKAAKNKDNVGTYQNNNWKGSKASIPSSSCSLLSNSLNKPQSNYIKSTPGNATLSTSAKPGNTFHNNFQKFQHSNTANPRQQSPYKPSAQTHFSRSSVTSSTTGPKASIYSHYGKTNNNAQTRCDDAESAVVAAVTAPSPTKAAAALVKGKCVLISQTRLMVDVGFHAGMIEVFKSMSTRQYDMQTKKWSFDLKEYNLLMQKLAGLGKSVYIEPLPRTVVSAFSTYISKGQLPPASKPDVNLSEIDDILVTALMPFQREGVNFAVGNKGRVLIADDMGLGKTLQSLCIAAYYRHEWPLLIVVPSSVRFSWREQILKWLPSIEPQEINVTVTGKDSATCGLVNIISYDLMVKVKQQLCDKCFRVIIMDESHSLKNSKTARYQAARPILKHASRVILLSGTPALSRPAELFTQISSVDATIFPSFHSFGVRYCDGKQNPWGWDFSGSSNLAELQLVLEKKIMVRRLKKDVLDQLPSKCRQMVILDPNSVKINKAMKASHTMVDKLKGNERRGELLQYFNETGSAKIKAVKEYVLEMLEGDRKFLVFAHHQIMLNAIEEAVTVKKYKSIRIDGKVSSEQRNYLVNRFQENDDVCVAILSITAANSGINLTAASLVVFAELFWNPGILMQAEDRAHRIGQQDNVTVHYLVAPGTADDYIWPLVQKKLDVLGKAGLSKEDLSEADTKRLMDPKQKEILEFFEESFMEDDLPYIEPEMELQSSTMAGTSKDTVSQQSNLFQYFKSNSAESLSGNNRSCDGKNTSNSKSELLENAEIRDRDWLDELNDDWDDPDAPWPPQPKKSKLH